MRHLGKTHQWVAAVLALPEGAPLDDVDVGALAGYGRALQRTGQYRRLPVSSRK